MATTGAMGTPSLDDCIQALPQELQDEIFDYTIDIETDPDSAIELFGPWQIPWQMHIDRKSRALVAKRYFSENSFTHPPLLNDALFSTSFRVCLDRLKQLPESHTRAIQEIHLGVYYCLPQSVTEILQSPARTELLALVRSVVNPLADFLELLEKCYVLGGLQLREGTLKVDWVRLAEHRKGSDEKAVAGTKAGHEEEKEETGGAAEGEERGEGEQRWLSAKELRAVMEEI